MLLALHEESAVAIAHGYAKITGKPMGVVLHSNVGLLHASMAIFNARASGCRCCSMAATVRWMPPRAVPRSLDAYLHRPGGAGAPLHQVDNQPASLAATAEAMLRASMIAQTTPCAPTVL